MLEAVFDVPLGVAGPAIVLGLVAFALGGLRLVRRRVLRLGGERRSDGVRGGTGTICQHPDIDGRRGLSG